MHSIARGPRLAPSAVSRAVAGSGEPLSAETRKRLEPQCGVPLGDVRIHTDPSVSDVDAYAYTVGRHIVFGPGLFTPNTPAGSRRRAHELAHVVQQRSRPGSDPVASNVPAVVAPHGSPAEQEAHRAAVGTAPTGVRSGVEDSGVPASGPVLQRQPRGAAESAHYPDESEQSRIEKLLRRDKPPTTQSPPAVPAASPQGAPAPAPIVVRGRHLNDAERHALATRLVSTLVTDLTTIAGQVGMAEWPASEDEAMEIVERARGKVLERYGSYTRAIALTRDASLSVAARRARNLVLVQFVDTGDAGVALARTRMDYGCSECQAALAGLDDESKAAVAGEVLGALQAGHAELLRKAALKGVGGSHTTASIRVPPRGESGLGTAVHELIHELAHPAFEAAFMDERNIIEGFTEYFTREVVSDRTNYQDIYQPVSQVGAIVSGPFLFSGRHRGEESMRLAYFGGRLDMIGWVPSGPEEERAVRDAGGSPAWDARLCSDPIRAGTGGGRGGPVRARQPRRDRAALSAGGGRSTGHHGELCPRRRQFRPAGQRSADSRGSGDRLSGQAHPARRQPRPGGGVPGAVVLRPRGGAADWQWGSRAAGHPGRRVALPGYRGPPLECGPSRGRGVRAAPDPWLGCRLGCRSHRGGRVLTPCPIACHAAADRAASAERSMPSVETITRRMD